MNDPYFITWQGFLIHLLLMAPLAVFAWRHRNDEGGPDDE